MTYPLDESTSGSGFKIQGVGGEDIQSHKLVYLSPDGKWYKSSASSVSTMPSSAITYTGILKDRKGGLLLLGLMSLNSWNFMRGQLIYASTIRGELTQTIPSNSGNQVQVIGRALTTTLILFVPSYVLVEVE